MFLTPPSGIHTDQHFIIIIQTRYNWLCQADSASRNQLTRIDQDRSGSIDIMWTISFPLAPYFSLW